MTQPPPLPVTPPTRETDAACRSPRLCARVFLLAAVLELAGAVLVGIWLARDWSMQWHDKTFVDSVYLSYGGLLIYAFGKWGLMAVLVLYFAVGALLLSITAAVFRASARPWLLSSLAAISLFVVPAGSLAGLHALRRLHRRSG